MNSSEIEQDLEMFKSEMLIHRPFFGDILLRLPIVRDDSVRTACTDGRVIRWNSAFFSRLSSPQRHYVLMHEVMHTLLMHPVRMQDHDREIWNIAADMVVNQICDQISANISTITGQPLMERPEEGIFGVVPPECSMETLYGLIAANIRKKGNRRIVKRDYRPFMLPRDTDMEITPDDDLLPGGEGGGPLTAQEQKELEEQIKLLIRNAGEKGRDAFGNYYVPRELLKLIEPKPIEWRRLLKEYLTEVTSDDTSYATPERKYLHMDLILPGHGRTDDGDLESLWAFVDSSGSIGSEEMNQFLTQLYRIVREFHCELNLCYWDTEVTDVYKKIRNEKHVLDCIPHHSGGTDINCVYRWMEKNKVRPDVMLILTDGYFGVIDSDVRKLLLPSDTILVISNESSNSEYKTIGRVCRLT